MATRREAELLEELEAVRSVAHEATARCDAILGELSALRRGREDVGQLRTLERTEAILSVLRSSKADLSPKEIHQELVDGGRTEQLNVVTATLSHLLARGHVRRPARGRYFAP